MKLSSDWYPRRRAARAGVPACLRPWLTDPRSLTRRLRSICREHFRVRLLSQKWQRPLREEARALAIPADQSALIREVFLECDGKPWVFARTVIPVRTLRGSHRRLAKLGSRPLGAVLFSGRSIERGAVELRQLCADHPLHLLTARALGESLEDVWARRSVFRLQGKQLLVSEVFLPELPDG